MSGHLQWSRLLPGPTRPFKSAPADRGPQAPVSARYTASLLIVMLLSVAGCGGSTAATRLAPVWARVQEHFERLERFELDFRRASAAEVGKVDAEKLEFVRNALEERAGLQVVLEREMKRASKTLLSESQAVRALYLTNLRNALEHLKVVQEQTRPSIENLGLQKYTRELREYRRRADRAAAGESR